MSRLPWSLSAWCLMLCPLTAAPPEISLFNGKDLTGWKGDAKLWKVEGDAIVGNSPGLKVNHFLVTEQEYGDFELRFEVKLHEPAANSGVQFRSQREPNTTEMIGYQADIGKGVWGGLYDESRRRKFVAQPTPEVEQKAVREKEWNQYVVRAVGRKITMTINGVTTVDYEELDEKIPQTGYIALQVHAGEPFRVEFRKIVLKPITKP